MLSTQAFQCPAELLARARSACRVSMAVIGAGDPLSLESARLATDQGLIQPCLIGARTDIRAAARRIDWNIDEYRIIDVAGEHEAARAGAAMARDAEVGALMKGHVHTDALMRAVVSREARLRTERRISHAFYMSVPDRDGALIITDAAVNVSPGIDQKLDITRNVVDMMHALGNPRPRIAMLSATEEPSEAMPSSLAAAEVAEKAAAIAGATVAGPMALDNAISPAAAAIKGIDNPVAGRAEVLVVPNIETGNALFKAMVYLMSATAAGVVLGARVPVVLTSRADPPEARLASAALAAIIASSE